MNPNTTMPEKVYRVYTAHIRQTGTTAPTVRKLLQNNTGVTMTWTYVATGNYRLNASEAIFEDTKTIMTWSLNTGGWVVMEYLSPTQLIVRSLNETGSGANGVMFDCQIEFKLYS